MILFLVRAWPTTVAGLIREQEELARATRQPWRPTGDPAIGACFVCFARGKTGPGEVGDPGWAGAAVMRGGRFLASAVVTGKAGAAYEPGLLALREGPLLEAAVRDLPEQSDVLLVNATGLDHPRGAGLALHLGAVRAPHDRNHPSLARRRGRLAAGRTGRNERIPPGWQAPRLLAAHTPRHAS